MNLEKEVKRKVNQILKLRRQLFVIEVISQSRYTVKQKCKELGIPRSTYYDRKKRYDLDGEEGLKRRKPITNTHPKFTAFSKSRVATPETLATKEKGRYFYRPV